MTHNFTAHFQVNYLNFAAFTSAKVCSVVILHIFCNQTISLFTGLPDPFTKISVDGTGQVYSTDTCKSTLDPKWNTYYDLFLSKSDGITITIWNQKKIRKGGGFLGCVRIPFVTVQRLKDNGCKYKDIQ